MSGVVEIITGRERRRRWRLEDKLRIVAETQEPGARVCDVAARHGLCDSLVFTWRRQARAGVLVAADMPSFVPVQVGGAAPSAAALSACPGQQLTDAISGLAAGVIEIELRDGSRVRVGSDVNQAALRRVLAALRR